MSPRYAGDQIGRPQRDETEKNRSILRSMYAGADLENRETEIEKPLAFSNLKKKKKGKENRHSDPWKDEHGIWRRPNGWFAPASMYSHQ